MADAAFSEAQAPYPGLRPFETHEADVFFGREQHTDRLLDILQRERFLAVIGPSGSGKSSLVRAGLLPSLTMGSLGSGSDWRIAVLRPGDQPMLSLAGALLQPAVFGRPDSEADAAGELALLAAELRRGPLGLLHAVAALRERGPAGQGSANLLVLVDQFEELFTYAEASGRQADESEAFVNGLLAARADAGARIHVALTMRTDFLGNCVRFADLPEAINRAQYLTPRLTRDQMALAIAGPAEVFGGSVETSLVAELINTTGQNPDQLPLLQHALARMWAVATARDAASPRIGWDDAAAIGGLAGALAQHAEAVFADLRLKLGAADVPLVEALFCAITERRASTAGGQDVRRPQTLRAIAQAGSCGPAGEDWPWFVPIVRAFAAPEVCMLQHGRTLDADSVIDLTHEAVMRQWPRLAGWVADAARRGSEYRRFAERAAEHTNGDSGLLEGTALARALDWRGAAGGTGWVPTGPWAERYALGNDAAGEFQRTIDFIDASAAQAQRRIDDEKQRREREWLAAEERTQAAMAASARSRRITLWFGMFAAALAALAVQLYRSIETSRDAQRRAETAEATARSEQARAEGLARQLNAQLSISEAVAPAAAAAASAAVNPPPANPALLPDLPTDAMLAAIMPASSEASRALYLPVLRRAMADFGINSGRRQAHFLGQVAYESGDLRYTQERWGPTASQLRYEPPNALAASLGNTQPGDGKRFLGRGIFQIVGRGNYKKYGDALGVDLVGNPEQVALPEGAVRTAAIFWKLRGLNELADADDVAAITRRISGGTNGLETRQQAVERAKQALTPPGI